MKKSFLLVLCFFLVAASAQPGASGNLQSRRIRGKQAWKQSLKKSSNPDINYPYKVISNFFHIIRMI